MFTEEKNPVSEETRMTRQRKLSAVCRASVKLLPYLFAVLAVFILFPNAADAQTQLVFNDPAPTLETGTALSQGARYRFHTITPGTDALVTISTVSAGATLVTLDDNTTFPERFQPTIRTTAANANAYIRFDFVTVAAGTSTPRFIPGYFLSAQDIDGDGTTNGMREWVEFFNTGTVTVASPTFLTAAAPIIGGTRFIQSSSANNQASIGTDDRYEMYAPVLNNSTTFTIVGGNTVGSSACTGTVCDRQNSYAFDPTSANQPQPAPDVSITKTGPASVSQNGTVTYTLIAKNNGPTTANGATVTDNVPASLTNVTITCAATGGAICPATTGLTTLSNVFINTFPSGGQVVFTIIGTASTVGTLTNIASIAPPNGAIDPNPANNTSATVTTTVNGIRLISGTVFEDSGYAGGAGRSLAASGGTPRGGAKVELYNSSGILLTSTTTATSGSVGQFQFTALAAGSYTVRVVNSTVSSARTGYVSTLVGVQTFRTNEGAADTNRVGGEDPTKTDAGANTTLASLAALLTGTTTTAESISPVTLSLTADSTGVDFGFNFDTVVNINDAGQGSLRQFITNANALNGADTSIFMISDGASHNGLRSGLTNQLTVGIAVVTLASLLPPLNDGLTTIDGTTQTDNVGNTNSGSFGTGGTVGADNLSLSTVQRPEVQITDGAANLALGLDLQGTGEIVRGISIYGFGTTINSDTSANIRIGANAANALIEQNIIGTTANSFSDPGATARSTGDNVRSVGARNGILRNNLIGFSASKGFAAENGSSGWLIENNEVRGNAIGNPNLDGIDFETAATTGNIVRGNLIADNEGVGVDSFGSNGSNTIQNNTITNNGIGTAATAETSGVRIYGSNNLVDRNKIYSNYGAGVTVTAAASANTITRNSIYANGTIVNKGGAAASNQIGIDLLNSTDNVNSGTSPFVTLNDAGDADTGGNGLLNFPVFESAQILNGNLILKGFAAPGATIELFIAAPDASGFGEGQTYLLTLNEGSAQDTDATTGTYTSPAGGRNVGTDTTNRFNFSIALPSGVAPGTTLTATATVSAATSEFSNNITIINAPPNIALVKSVTPGGTQLPGTELTYTINFTNSGGQAAANFALTDPNPANTTLKLNTDTDFKIGSVVNTFGTSGLTATVVYSKDNAATFTYTPVSAGGGAPAGFDRSVTHIRWNFTGSLGQTAPNNTGSVSFTVRIR